MLTTDDDLHEARKTLFNVTDSWRPPADPIGEPLGNPSVDRVLKNVNRYLMNCQQRWGNPVSVNIEHVRSSFSSVAFARKDKREYEKNNEKRSIFRSSLSEQLRADEQMEKCVNPITEIGSHSASKWTVPVLRPYDYIPYVRNGSYRSPERRRLYEHEDQFRCGMCRMQSYEIEHSICDLGKERGCPNSRGKPC